MRAQTRRGGGSRYLLHRITSLSGCRVSNAAVLRVIFHYSDASTSGSCHDAKKGAEDNSKIECLGGSAAAERLDQGFMRGRSCGVRVSETLANTAVPGRVTRVLLCSGRTEHYETLLWQELWRPTLPEFFRSLHRNRWRILRHHLAIPDLELRLRPFYANSAGATPHLKFSTRLAFRHKSAYLPLNCNICL